MYLKKVLTVISIIILIFPYAVVHAAVNEIEDVVVGSMFLDKKSEETVHFSNKNELFYSKCKDEELIISKLSNITNIYRRSSEIMKKYKN